MARFGRSYPISRFIKVNPALETQSVIVVLGTEDEDQGIIARLAIVHAPTIFISEDISATALTGIQAASKVGTINLSTTGLTTLLTGVSSSASAHDGFSFTGLVTSGKWQQDKTKKNVPRGRWNRHKNFDNKNFEVGEDFVPVIDQYGQFRVSTISRDRITLSSLQSISDNLSIQGRP